MKKVIFLVTVLLFVACAAQAGMNSKGAAATSNVEVTAMSKGDYGPMEAREIEEKTSATNVELEIAEDIWVPVVTDQIPVKAEGRTRFGFKWSAQGTPENSVAEFIYRVIRPNGEQMHAPMQHSLGEQHDIYFWCADEMCVPGRYVLEVESPQGHVLSQDFYLQ